MAEEDKIDRKHKVDGQAPYKKSHDSDHISRNKCDHDDTDTVGITQGRSLSFVERNVSKMPSHHSNLQDRNAERHTLLYTAVTMTVPIISSQFAIGM